MRPCRLWDGLSGAEEPAARTSILSLAVRAPSAIELLGPKRYVSEVNYLAAAPRHSANRFYELALPFARITPWAMLREGLYMIACAGNCCKCPHDRMRGELLLPGCAVRTRFLCIIMYSYVF